ncbi:MAG: heme-binding protein, partial [Schleiferiaceae bacterium]|nr:heme-binding protein [Schleiferiaceae bacterium]
MTKKRMWTLLAISAVAIVGIAFASFRSGEIETPNYLVLKKYGDVELRQYSNMIVAKTSVGDNSFENSGSNGFRVIANYIFVGNDPVQKIALTSTVVMYFGYTPTMFFVIP